ncbi:hypothetical protein EMCRGX_G025970 [Ephydatia muelleri]
MVEKEAFKRPMRIESSIEDVGTLDSVCLPGSSCNESKMSMPDCLTVGNVGFLRISGEEMAPVDTSNSHSTTVIGEDLNSVLRFCYHHHSTITSTIIAFTITAISVAFTIIVDSIFTDIAINAVEKSSCTSIFTVAIDTTVLNLLIHVQIIVPLAE